MIDLAFLEKLLDLLNRSTAETIEIRRWRTSVRVSKGGNSAAGPATYQVTAPPGTPLPAGSAVGAAAAPALSSLVEIKSPMVGTFYARPEPGADPYVRVGSRISVGEPLCIIEAMKIMNPLDAEVVGVIREVCVEDAQPVEFGHVLFRVDPHG
ncbi:MAG TPA: acetyl-CoA carboxylase biotin carboxyl carrier protein [Gemmatimonadales bacterium]